MVFLSSSILEFPSASAYYPSPCNSGSLFCPPNRSQRFFVSLRWFYLLLPRLKRNRCASRLTTSSASIIFFFKKNLPGNVVVGSYHGLVRWTISVLQIYFGVLGDILFIIPWRALSAVLLKSEICTAPSDACAALNIKISKLSYTTSTKNGCVQGGSRDLNPDPGVREGVSRGLIFFY